MQEDKKKLRIADLVTAVILIVFSGAMLISALLTIPLAGKYAGIENQWYVSPGLVPIFVCGSLLAMSIGLLIFAVREGGLQALVETVTNFEIKDKEETARFWIILVELTLFVFLYIPRVDFFAAIVLFLFYTIAGYHFGDHKFLLKLTLVYLVNSVLIFLTAVSGLLALMPESFPYLLDVFTLCTVGVMTVLALQFCKEKGKEYMAYFWQALSISWITPLVIVPVFSYKLFVLMPHKGVIIDYLDLIFYSIVRGG